MKKLLLLLFAAIPFTAAFGYSNSENDASKAADSLYKSGASVSETLALTRPIYAKWAAEQLAESRKIFTVSPFKGSFAINSRYFKPQLDAINPLKNKIDKDFVFSGEKIWRPINISVGESSDLNPIINPYYYSDAVCYLVCTINSKEDYRALFTFASSSGNLYLNGKLLKSVNTSLNVPKNAKVYTSNMNSDAYFVELDLKKGENTLVYEFDVKWSKVPLRFMYAPYADASVFLAKKLCNQFPIQTRTVPDWREFESSRIPTWATLFSIKSNEDFLKLTPKHGAEEAWFEAGELEKQYMALSGKSDEASEIARIDILCKFAESSYLGPKIGYSPKNLRPAFADLEKMGVKLDPSVYDKLDEFEKELPAIRAGVLKGDKSAEARADEFRKFAAEILLKNPLLEKSPKWVFVQRDSKTRSRGLPQNWQGNSPLLNVPWRMIPESKHTYDDELWVADFRNPGSAKLLWKPQSPNAISDIDVSYDGKKILFSTVWGEGKNKWMTFQLDELDVDSGKTRQISPRLYEMVDAYDGVYLPDGRILFCSNACYVGVPCVSGCDAVGNLYTLDPDAGDANAVDNSIRQLTFEQDADWMPVVMENGRILYTRWEYTDNSHYFSRILMHMNPDGTAQSSFYGSVSYWPNSIFYCRPIPGDPNKFVGIVSGHHGIARQGELHLFDISKGTKEDSGRVHRFPSFGRKYEARTLDELVHYSWPRMLHPYPLSEKYVVASVQLRYGYRTSIYLIDAFDNMTLLADAPNKWLMEPVPLQPRKLPPEIMDKTNPELDYGFVFLNDIYKGDGLKDVPRGTVKKLRVFEYDYCYWNMGGHDIVAYEGSWDVKRILGTVDVLEDGSAFFKVPANRPIAIQPLDAEGKALALMRSWFAVMPGETQSCVGCHETQGMTATTKPAMAARKAPQEIKQFVAPARGYSFVRDVQPVLDKYCVGCHDGTKPGRPNFARGDRVWSNFPQAYLDLHRYVRRSGPESNQNMLAPLEFNVDSSALMQMLKKGHKGVKLDKQSMDILITWMDLNVPCIGTWQEVADIKNKGVIPFDGHKMRMKLLAKYANRHNDPNEIIYDGGKQEFVKPGPEKKHEGPAPKLDGFPFDAKAAKEKIAAEKLPEELLIDLGGGLSMRLALVPSGSFVMGSNNGFYDEGPARIEKIEKPFYMGQLEVSNAQFRAFDKTHHSGYIDRHYKDHVNRGYPADGDDLSVIRVTWNQADAFCKWLSQKTGLQVSLPTEKQWEWAARAGSDKDFWFGNVGENFSRFENFSDWQTKKFAVDNVDPQPMPRPNMYQAFVPADHSVDDGSMLTAVPGSYMPNPFNLYDMNGNISEWTADDYTETLGGKKVEDRKTVRGGSWRDTPKWSRTTIRRDYRPWQRVYNVGFRVVVNNAAEAAKVLPKAAPLPEKNLVSRSAPQDTLPPK